MPASLTARKPRWIANSLTSRDYPGSETPQSITVVPRQLIDEQGLTTRRDVLRTDLSATLFLSEPTDRTHALLPCKQPATVGLTDVYHNLLRQWADV